MGSLQNTVPQKYCTSLLYQIPCFESRFQNFWCWQDSGQSKIDTAHSVKYLPNLPSIITLILVVNSSGCA